MSSSTSTSTASPFIAEDNAKASAAELRNFTKCVVGDISRLTAICCLSAIDGGSVSESCDCVGKPLLQHILNDAALMLVSGDMKVNGKFNNWSNGCFGSRWFDMDAEPYGIDYIRGAFYSKKTFKGEWKWEKPYAIEIMVEKAK